MYLDYWIALWQSQDALSKMISFEDANIRYDEVVCYICDLEEYERLQQAIETSDGRLIEAKRQLGWQ